MHQRVRALLACPACAGEFDDAWRCSTCGAAYGDEGGVPLLRLPGNQRTEAVRAFYADAPFPGYPPHDSITWLRSRAERSPFPQLLDAAIPGDASIVEIGCGTGQMSLYLARADRIVIGADLTLPSLVLGARAAARFNIPNVAFVETDLNRPALRAGAFDCVYCSGVLHHTPDPRKAFESIVRLARPGGTIIIGLYNCFARLPLRLRRWVARLTRERWIPFDPVLRDRRHEPARLAAWLRDQYRHPEEHRHSVGEIRQWFAEQGVDYLRSYPSTFIAEGPEKLLDRETDYWPMESWLSQLGWAASLGGEGGLFVAVGRKRSLPAHATG